jgi:hypothetical protein
MQCPNPTKLSKEVLGMFGKPLMLGGDFVSFRPHVLKKFEF